MTLLVSGGIFNPATATCGTECTTCCGYSNYDVTPNPVFCPLTFSEQLDSEATYCSGNVQNFTSSCGWSSTDTSIATVSSSGLVSAVGAGSCSILAQFPTLVIHTGQICSPQGTVQCPRASRPAGNTTTVPDSTITVKFSGSKSAGNNLSFVIPPSCSQSLGGPLDWSLAWVWNVEISASISDDASVWTASQNTDSGRREGLILLSDGNFADFDQTFGGPDTINAVQQTAGQDSLFWLDSPGHLKNFTNGPIHSITQVQNFTSKVCHNNVSVCRSVQWHLKLVVDPGPVLNTTQTAAGFGHVSTNF